MSAAAVSPATLAELKQALKGLGGDRAAYGERNLIARVDAVRALAFSDAMLPMPARYSALPPPLAWQEVI